MAAFAETGDLLDFGNEASSFRPTQSLHGEPHTAASSSHASLLSVESMSAALPRPSVGRSLVHPSQLIDTDQNPGNIHTNANMSSSSIEGYDSGHGSGGGYESPGSGGNYDSGHGSGGYDSGGYDSGGYDSGGGWNSDDSLPSESRPKSSLAAIFPLEKMVNGWQVVSRKCFAGARAVAGKAAEAYNNKTFTDLRSATVNTANTIGSNIVGFAASTPSVLSEGWNLTKDSASGAAGATLRVAGGAWKVTKPVVMKTTSIIKKGFISEDFGRTSKSSFSGNQGSGSSAVNSGPGQFDTSPLSLSPPMSSYAGSPDSGSYVSPVSQSPPLSPRQSFSEPPDLMNA